MSGICAEQLECVCVANDLWLAYSLTHMIWVPLSCYTRTGNNIYENKHGIIKEPNSNGLAVVDGRSLFGSKETIFRPGTIQSDLATIYFYYPPVYRTIQPLSVHSILVVIFLSLLCIGDLCVKWFNPYELDISAPDNTTTIAIALWHWCTCSSPPPVILFKSKDWCGQIWNDG